MDREKELAKLRKKYPLLSRKRLEGMLNRRSYKFEKTPEGFRSKQRQGNMSDKKADAMLEEARARSKAKETYIMSQNIEPQAGIRRGNQAIDLQSVEVPTGDMFNTDDFNRYLGAMSTLGRSKFYQDKIDDPIYLEMNSLRSKLINAKQK